MRHILNTTKLSQPGTTCNSASTRPLGQHLRRLLTNTCAFTPSIAAPTSKSNAFVARAMVLAPRLPKLCPPPPLPVISDAKRRTTASP